MTWRWIFSSLTVVLCWLHSYLNLLVIRKALAIVLFLEIFYLIGHYTSGWPFPSPVIMLQILNAVGLGVALGVVFSRIWPLAPKPGSSV